MTGGAMVADVDMPNARREHRSVSPALVTVSLLSVSFIVSYAIALRLYDLRVFEQPDVWFSADPDGYDRLFSRAPLVDLRHPMLSPLVFGVVTALARVLAALGMPSGTSPELRAWLVILVAPAAAAARSFLLLGVFRRLTGRLWPSVLLALLDITAFATVTLGSVPESYGLSAMCIAAMYWLALDEVPRRSWVRAALWLLVGTAAIGITLSNVIPLVVLLVVALLRRGEPIGRAARNTAALVGTASVLTGLLAQAVSSKYRDPELADRTLQITQSALHPINGFDVSELAWSLSHTVVAPAPRLEPGWAGRLTNPDYDFIVSYRRPFQHGSASVWRSLVTVALLLLGAAGFARRGTFAPLPIAALGVLAGNILMHLFWGDHYFVYALHWQASLLVLLAGLGLYEKRGHLVGDILLAGLALVTVVNSWVQLRDLLARLAVV